MHTWGDGFDFDRLGEAMDYLGDMFRHKTGKSIIMKEKYGTIRYEFEGVWLIGCDYDKNEPEILFDNRQAFANCLLATVCSFPDMAAELTNDIDIEDLLAQP
jgi:hypothetical protein